MYDKLLFLESAKVDFSPSSILTLNIAIGLIMVGVAMGIKLENFKKLFKAPKPFFVGITSQFLLLPALTFVLTITLPIPESVALGMILVASCPGGNISNFMSSYARANIELSVSLTMFATLAAWILTPLNFAFWGNWFLRIAAKKHEILTPIDIDFWQMLQTITYILLIPLLFGIFISYKFPKFTKKIVGTVKKVSMFVFVIIILLALLRNSKQASIYVAPVFLLVLVHSTIGYLTGYTLSSITKLGKRNIRTITIETGIQNAGLALALIFNPKLFAGSGGMAVVAAWWGVWAIISGVLIALFWSFKKIKE